MPGKRVTLSQKLFAYYFALILLTIIVLSSYSYYSAKNALITRTYEQLNSVKFEKERNLERYLKERSREISEMSGLPDWQFITKKPGGSYYKSDELLNVIKAEYNDKLKGYFTGNSYYNQLIFNCGEKVHIDLEIGDDGTLKRSLFPKHFELSDSELFKKIYGNNAVQIIESRAGDLYIGSVVESCDCINSKAALLVRLNPEIINKIMYNANKMNGLGETGEAYIVGSDSTMRTTSRFKGFHEKRVKVRTEGVEAALNNISGTGHYKDYRNIDILGAYGKINIQGLNWVILAEIDVREAMVPIYTLRNSIIILSLIISLLLFGGVLIITRRITQPLLKLKKATEDVSLGNYDIHVDVLAQDEIGELSRAFNRMVDKIREQNKELEQERSLRITSVFDGQEQERQRLARELHDGLGQRILAVKMQLERAEIGNPELKQKLIENARLLLASVSKEMVEMSENLMPHLLTEFGLVSAIENLCEEIQATHNIAIKFSYDEIPGNCPAKAKIYLFRIIQEALNNMVKHAGAKNAAVSLHYEKNLMHLCIMDDGKGFDKSQIRKGANGIMNMRDRVEILGGKFNITSSIQQGTKIESEISLNITD